MSSQTLRAHCLVGVHTSHQHPTNNNATREKASTQPQPFLCFRTCWVFYGGWESFGSSPSPSPDPNRPASEMINWNEIEFFLSNIYSVRRNLIFTFDMNLCKLATAATTGKAVPLGEGGRKIDWETQAAKICPVEFVLKYVCMMRCAPLFSELEQI